MKAINDIIPRKYKHITPECMTGATYEKVGVGATLRVVHVAISRYQARNKDGASLFKKDGSPLLKETGYIRFEKPDGHDGFTTVGGYTALEQIKSIDPEVLDSDLVGVTECPCYVKVRMISVPEELGNKTYDYLAFEVLDN